MWNVWQVIEIAAEKGTLELLDSATRTGNIVLFTVLEDMLGELVRFHWVTGSRGVSFEDGRYERRPENGVLLGRLLSAAVGACT